MAHIFIAIIKQDLGVNVTLSNTEVVEKSDLIVLAVKPNVVQPVLQEVAETVSKEKLLVSIAAGIPLKSIEQVTKERKCLSCSLAQKIFSLVQINPGPKSNFLDWAKFTAFVDDNKILLKRRFLSLIV